MEINLNEIKELRKRLGITQHELATKADVSQSLIAKIESGRIDPTYSNAVKIFRALEGLSKKHESAVAEVMQKRIISAKPDDSVQDAVKKMKKHEISQLPVIKNDAVLGMLSESAILDSLTNGKSASKAGDVMLDTPPIISKKTSVKAASTLLKFCPLVLVSDKGKIAGLVTKSDVLRSVYR